MTTHLSYLAETAIFPESSSSSAYRPGTVSGNLSTSVYRYYVALRVSFPNSSVSCVHVTEVEYLYVRNRRDLFCRPIVWRYWWPASPRPWRTCLDAAVRTSGGRSSAYKLLPSISWSGFALWSFLDHRQCRMEGYHRLCCSLGPCLNLVNLQLPMIMVIGYIYNSQLVTSTSYIYRICK